MLELVTGGTVAAEAKMIRAKFGGAVFVVEGEADVRLLERHTSSKHCKLLCARGKSNVIDALHILKRDGFSGVLGLVDADFDRINDTLPEADELVVCDFADSEMMVLVSPALDKVLGEYGSAQKVAKFREASSAPSVLEHILNEASKIAAIRYVSVVRGWNLCFRGLDVGKLVHGPSLSVDPLKVAKAVAANSKGAGVSSSDICNAVTEEADAKDAYDLREFCCGHDCTGMLAAGMRQCLASHPKAVASKDNVERLLRIAYDHAYFMATDLFASICRWETENPGYKVVP